MRLQADYLDDVCEEMFGHKDWTYVPSGKGVTVVAFNHKPSKEFLEGEK